jgi:hypothetical protein
MGDFKDRSIELATEVLRRSSVGRSTRHEYANGKGTLAGCSLGVEQIELAGAVLHAAGMEASAGEALLEGGILDRIVTDDGEVLIFRPAILTAKGIRQLRAGVVLLTDDLSARAGSTGGGSS